MEETILSGSDPALLRGGTENPNGELSASIDYHRYFYSVSELNHLAPIDVGMLGMPAYGRAFCGTELSRKIGRFESRPSLAGKCPAGASHAWPWRLVALKLVGTVLIVYAK